MSGGRSQNSGIPRPGGDSAARGAGTPGILVLGQFLICGLVTQACSFCEDSPSCALRICAFFLNACNGLMKRFTKQKQEQSYVQIFTGRMTGRKEKAAGVGNLSWNNLFVSFLGSPVVML